MNNQYICDQINILFYAKNTLKSQYKENSLKNEEMKQNRYLDVIYLLRFYLSIQLSFVCIFSLIEKITDNIIERTIK